MTVRVQDVLGRALAQHVSPALRAAGLSRHGRRTWHRREGDAWVGLGVEVDKYSTRSEMTLSVLTTAWPPGTATAWLSEPDDVPPVGGNAPFSAWPDEIDPRLDQFWHVRADTDDLGGQLATYCVEVALPWARERVDVDRALSTVPPTHAPRWALEMLAHAAPGHPRRRDLAETYVAQWVLDPRPITEREWVARLIDELHLPPRELPTWQSVALIPRDVEELHGGDPIASWRAHLGHGRVYLADGTSQPDPPQHGLGPMGVRAEQLPRREGPFRLFRRVLRG